MLWKWGSHLGLISSCNSQARLRQSLKLQSNDSVSSPLSEIPRGDVWKSRVQSTGDCEWKGKNCLIQYSTVHAIYAIYAIYVISLVSLLSSSNIQIAQLTNRRGTIRTPGDACQDHTIVIIIRPLLRPLSNLHVFPRPHVKVGCFPLPAAQHIPYSEMVATGLGSMHPTSAYLKLL